MMEISIEVPQKVKNGTINDPAVPIVYYSVIRRTKLHCLQVNG
jgi:hypothetical protein